MSAIFVWDEDHGAATGTPAKGTLRSPGVGEVNWKAIDDSATAYSAPTAQIQNGQNSMVKNQFGHLSGTFNNVSNGYFAHTLGALPTGCTLKGPPTCTSDGTALPYVAPSQTARAALTSNMTPISSILLGINNTSALLVAFGTVGPEATVNSPAGATAKAATQAHTPGVDLYTNYLATQILTSGAPSGDGGPITMTIQFDEN